jgi:hypothetical protein
MLSSHGGLDTGAQKLGAFETSQSQVNKNETKTELTVNVKSFLPHHFFGHIYWM